MKLNYEHWIVVYCCDTDIFDSNLFLNVIGFSASLPPQWQRNGHQTAGPLIERLYLWPLVEQNTSSYTWKQKPGVQFRDWKRTKYRVYRNFTPLYVDFPQDLPARTILLTLLVWTHHQYPPQGAPADQGRLCLGCSSCCECDGAIPHGSAGLVCFLRWSFCGRNVEWLEDVWSLDVIGALLFRASRVTVRLAGLQRDSRRGPAQNNKKLEERVC